MKPSDIARSLGHRIRNQAEARGVDAQRLRRVMVFQRILVRLAADDSWVLKGGFCLEARLNLAARSTRDLDLSLAATGDSALDLQDRLADALEPDPQSDGFTFRVTRPTPTSADEMGNPGWRTTVVAVIGGAEFASVKVDVVARPDELDGGTETLVVEAPIPSAGHRAVTVRAVDVAQHAAEKVHAYCRVYAHERPSSRVKDLVDLVLLIEADLLDTAAVGARLRHVFRVRDDVAPPDALPGAPASWRSPYAAMAADLGLSAADLPAATSIVADLYRRAIWTATPNEGTP